jgi:hypothetical protein
MVDNGEKMMGERKEVYIFKAPKLFQAKINCPSVRTTRIT